MIHLVFERCRVDDFRLGDEIQIVYMNSHEHLPTRVGILTGFVGNPKKGAPYLKVWDYEANRYSNFTLDYIRDPGLLVPVAPAELLEYDRLRLYRMNIEEYARRLQD